MDILEFSIQLKESLAPTHTHKAPPYPIPSWLILTPSPITLPPPQPPQFLGAGTMESFDSETEFQNWKIPSGTQETPEVMKITII